VLFWRWDLLAGQIEGWSFKQDAWWTREREGGEVWLSGSTGGEGR